MSIKCKLGFHQWGPTEVHHTKPYPDWTTIVRTWKKCERCSKINEEWYTDEEYKRLMTNEKDPD